MEEVKDRKDNLAKQVEDLANTYYKLAIISATQKAVNIASASFVLIILGIAALFTILFAGIALAWWLGDLVNSRAGGFVIVAGVFLIVMVIVFLMRKKIVIPFIRDAIIRKNYE